VQTLGRVGQDRRQDGVQVVHDAEDDIHDRRGAGRIPLDLEPGRLAVQD
jgi:hypothetical protein